MNLKTITEVRIHSHSDKTLKHYIRFNQKTYEIRFDNKIHIIDLLEQTYIDTFYAFDDIIKLHPDAMLAPNIPNNISYLEAHYIPIKNMEVYTCDEWRKR